VPELKSDITHPVLESGIPDAAARATRRRLSGSPHAPHVPDQPRSSADAGELALNDYASSPASAPWPSGAGHTQQIPITAAGVGLPVLVRIPPATVARSVGPVRVRYSIVDAESNGRTSLLLNFTVTA
jgi:hypothetical protein